MPRKIRPSRLSIEELRALWLSQSDDAVRQVIEEVVFRREQAAHTDKKARRIENLCEIVRAEWQEEAGCKLIALEQLRGEIGDLRRLRGELPGEASPPDGRR
ncbi:hypothetical protein A9762_20650 [Pandoraea sp. ISTKB]|nr:hypothetical protein A9762_20650 [Pandoraea sp. ISTKB]